MQNIRGRRGRGLGMGMSMGSRREEVVSVGVGVIVGGADGQKRGIEGGDSSVSWLLHLNTEKCPGTNTHVRYA